MSSALTAAEARSLFAAAVTAVGPAPLEDPTERANWEARVADLAASIDRMAGAYVERLAELAEATAIPGHIVSVEPVRLGEGEKGLIVFRPLVGDAAAQGSTEDIRTGWLSNPKALAVFRSAQALVDRDAVLYKKMEAGDNRKFRVLVGIESAPHREEPNLPLGTDDADDASGMAARDEDASAAPTAGLDRARQVRTLLGLKPDTGEKLVSLASEHLGLDTAAVKAAMTTRFGPLRRGEKRNPSQYADCWAHLVQAQGHVRTRAAS